MEPQAVQVCGLYKRFGDTPVLQDATITVEAGTIVALLGPSGCGKTTLLRSIAGLEVPDAGEVHIGERVLTSATTNVAPERRRVGMVFQDWALFPHLSVADNVGYGLPRKDRGAASTPVRDALAMVGLGGLGDRSPGTLSGGQQQRVALARALAPRPSVLLLDEPFSNLDTTLRVQVRTEVHHLLTELDVTTVFVTHDQEEAFVLGDEVAVMEAGTIVQQAAPAVLYDAPLTPWVAEFVGDANLLHGTVSAGVAATGIGPVPVRHVEGGRADVLVRPELVAVSPGDDASVVLVEYYGHDTVYVLDLAGSTVRARVGGVPRLARGDRVALRYVGGPTAAWPQPSTSR